MYGMVFMYSAQPGKYGDAESGSSASTARVQEVAADEITRYVGSIDGTGRVEGDPNVF